MYCGIDVAKNKSQVCIIDENKSVINEFEIEHTREGFKKLEKHIDSSTKIGMETTGSYCKALYDYLKKRHDVIYVDNHQMFTFAKLHFSHLKNDKVDAKLIANYLTFNFKKVVPIRADELKDLSRLYDKTIKQSSKYKSMFKDQANVIFPELEKHFHLTKTKGIATLLLKYPSPKEVANLSNEEIYQTMTSDFKKYANLRNKEEFVKKLKKIAQESIGISDYPTSCFQYTIKVMLFYQELTEDIKKRMKECLTNSPYGSLLNEFGYSDTSLAIIVGEVGDIRRFPTHKNFVSYCGLDVSEKQSGKSMSLNCFITKRGNRILRHIFYLLVLVHLRYRKEGELAKFYQKLKERGKHPKQCMVATARKVAVKAYFDMMKCHNN